MELRPIMILINESKNQDINYGDMNEQKKT
jgi:hypothetical protein